METVIAPYSHFLKQNANIFQIPSLIMMACTLAVSVKLNAWMTVSSVKYVIHGFILNALILNSTLPVMCRTYVALYVVVSVTLVNCPSPAQHLLKMIN